MDENIRFANEELRQTFTTEWARLVRDENAKTGTLQGEVLRAAHCIGSAWFSGRGRDASGTESARAFLRTATRLRPQSGKLLVLAGLAGCLDDAADAAAYESALKVLVGLAGSYAEIRPLVRTDADAANA